VALAVALLAWPWPERPSRPAWSLRDLAPGLLGIPFGWAFGGMAGVGAFAAGVFHVVTHAFFKALLFLGAGSVIHALDEEQDIRRMGGLRAKLPVTYRTFFVATLAIAGVPGLSGFFSKDEILAATFASGHVALWVVGVVGAGFTAFYMTRLLVLTFFGQYRGDAHRWQHAHESPPTMAIPLTILAVLSIAGGYLGVPAILGGGDRFGHFLAPVTGHHEIALDEQTELLLMAVSVAVALVGIALGWWTYSRGVEADRALVRRAPRLRETLAHAYYVDETYDRAVVQEIVSGARWLWRAVDVGFIDALANGVAAAAQALGETWRRMASGNVQHYALAVLLGVVALMSAVALHWIG
jgi:NADH-quinone oxidoreductase subunit L